MTVSILMKRLAEFVETESGSTEVKYIIQQPGGNTPLRRRVTLIPTEKLPLE